MFSSQPLNNNIVKNGFLCIHYTKNLQKLQDKGNHFQTVCRYSKIIDNIIIYWQWSARSKQEWRLIMDVNTITNSTSSITNSYQNSTSTAKSKTSDTKYGNDTAAVYEKSDEAKNASTNKALIAKLKADVNSHISQMQNLVSQIFQKQGTAVNNADDMWKMLASGDFTVDADTANKAKEAISENGYWGVNQTSERIFDFAKALSGGDSDKMDKMLDAFKKGFDQATKAWGKNLPDISSQTYDAVMQKFSDYKNQQSDAVQ